MYADISIHSPYTGRDDDREFEIGEELPFQSTLPIQGETWMYTNIARFFHISIHSPYTGRDRKNSGAYFV